MRVSRRPSGSTLFSTICGSSAGFPQTETGWQKRRGQPVHGWVNLDKPVGMSSAKAVAIVRRVFNAAKAGHGGTLDPLASGVLPIALGEATKTVAYAMEGRNPTPLPSPGVRRRQPMILRAMLLRHRRCVPRRRRSQPSFLSSRGMSCRHRRHFRQSRLMANAPMNWRERRCGHPVLWVQTGRQTCQ